MYIKKGPDQGDLVQGGFVAVGLQTAFAPSSQTNLTKQRKEFLTLYKNVRRCMDNLVPEKYAERNKKTKITDGCLCGMMNTGNKYFPKLEKLWNLLNDGGLLGQDSKEFYAGLMGNIKVRHDRANEFFKTLNLEEPSNIEPSRA